VRWEQEIHSKLLRGPERDEVFAEHVVAGLLRGDQKARYDSYKIGREGGWLSANDVRELENMNPLPGTQGDIYIVPLNMIPAQQIGQPREGRADVLKARLARAHGRTIADAAGRMIRREAAAVRRAARKDGFRDRLVQFYARHRDIFVRSLEPAALACAEVLAAAWGVDDAQGLERLASDCVGGLVDAHCERARDTLERLAVAAEPEELEAAVARTMAAWEAEGPDRFASDLVDAEIKRLAKGAHDG
jgi:hypothetical protein